METKHITKEKLEKFLRLVLLEPHLTDTTRKMALQLFAGDTQPDTKTIRTGGGLHDITFELPINNWQKIRDLMKNGVGNKIQAIKELRMMTGWGLKEAKDGVEFAQNWED